MEKIVSRPTNESLGKPARTKRVPVMMTEDEYERIAAAAQAAGLGVSTFLRICALNAKPPST
ncbi:plasmid mobilization protein [Sulfitobacter sp. 1A12157]|uniref:plasmid mobilization protein n=1 Tax=Sulfitobacter sp. 1A12157 TaxID=3368594 RepID=UPI0037460D65